jgi:hypothetical protein
MAKVITTELQHSGASGANITLDSSKNVTVENNLTVDGTTTLTGAVTLPNDTVTIADLSATGTASSSTFLRGDNAWASAGLDGVTTGSGNVTITDGDLIIGTAGHGISFAATADTSKTGASMANELFDDYEKGTWTADLRYNWAGDCGFSTAPGHDVGTYVKIGDMVFAQCYIYNWTMTSGDGSAANIKGLPFISGNVNEHFWLANITYSNAFSETDVHAGYLNKGDDNIRPTRSSGDSAPTWSSSSGRYFMMSIFYST